MIQSRDFGFEPNYGNLVIKILFFSLRGRVLRAGPPGPPLFSVFCSPLPPTTLDPPGPSTDREIKNTRPRGETANRSEIQMRGSRVAKYGRNL